MVWSLVASNYERLHGLTWYKSAENYSMHRSYSVVTKWWFRKWLVFCMRMKGNNVYLDNSNVETRPMNTTVLMLVSYFVHCDSTNMQLPSVIAVSTSMFIQSMVFLINLSDISWFLLRAPLDHDIFSIVTSYIVLCWECLRLAAMSRFMSSMVAAVVYGLQQDPHGIYHNVRMITRFW